MKTIGPNPTLTRLTIPRLRAPITGETREQTLRRVAKVARRILNRLLTDPSYRYAHRSFAVRDAMLVAEAAADDSFGGVGTFGVECIPEGDGDNSPSIQYLNSGDTYSPTVMYVRGQFCVGDWGYYVENGSYA